MARPRRGDGRAAGPVSRQAVLILRGVTACPALVLTELGMAGWLTPDGETALEAHFRAVSESKALHSMDRMKHPDLTHPGPS